MTENVVLEILSAFIHNRKPCLNQDTQEDKLFYSFYIQGILPILAYMDKKWDIITDKKIKNELVDCYYQTIAVNFNKANMFEAISQIKQINTAIRHKAENIAEIRIFCLNVIQHLFF